MFARYSFYGLVYSRIRRRRDFFELEHKYDRALLEVDIVGLQYYVSSLRREQEEDKKKISQKECEIRKLADEKAELCNVIFKETSIYKKIEQLSHQEKTKNNRNCVFCWKMNRSSFAPLLWKYTRVI